MNFALKEPSPTSKALKNRDGSKKAMMGFMNAQIATNEQWAYRQPPTINTRSITPILSAKRFTGFGNTASVSPLGGPSARQKPDSSTPSAAMINSNSQYAQDLHMGRRISRQQGKSGKGTPQNQQQVSQAFKSPAYRQDSQGQKKDSKAIMNDSLSMLSKSRNKMLKQSQTTTSESQSHNQSLINQYGSQLQTVPEQQRPSKKQLQSSKQIKLNLVNKKNNLALELSSKQFQTSYKGGLLGAQDSRNTKHQNTNNFKTQQESAKGFNSLTRKPSPFSGQESPLSNLPRRQIDFGNKTFVQLDPASSSNFEPNLEKQFPASLKNKKGIVQDYQSAQPGVMPQSVSHKYPKKQAFMNPQIIQPHQKQTTTKKFKFDMLQGTKTCRSSERQAPKNSQQPQPLQKNQETEKLSQSTLNLSTQERQVMLQASEKVDEYGGNQQTGKNFPYRKNQFTQPSFASEQDSPATQNSLYVTPFDNSTNRADKTPNNNSTETTKFDEPKHQEGLQFHTFSQGQIFVSHQNTETGTKYYDHVKKNDQTLKKISEENSYQNNQNNQPTLKKAETGASSLTLKEKQSQYSQQENSNSFSNSTEQRDSEYQQQQQIQQQNETSFPSHSSVALEANVKLSQNIDGQKHAFQQHQGFENESTILHQNVIVNNSQISFFNTNQKHQETKNDISFNRDFSGHFEGKLPSKRQLAKKDTKVSKHSSFDAADEEDEEEESLTSSVSFEQSDKNISSIIQREKSGTESNNTRIQHTPISQQSDVPFYQQLMKQNPNISTDQLQTLQNSQVLSQSMMMQESQLQQQYQQSQKSQKHFSALKAAAKRVNGTQQKSYFQGVKVKNQNDPHNQSVSQKSYDYFEKMKKDMKKRKQTQMQREEMLDSQLLMNQTTISSSGQPLLSTQIVQNSSQKQTIDSSNKTEKYAPQIIHDSSRLQQQQQFYRDHSADNIMSAQKQKQYQQILLQQQQLQDNSFFNQSSNSFIQGRNYESLQEGAGTSSLEEGNIEVVNPQIHSFSKNKKAQLQTNQKFRQKCQQEQIEQNMIAYQSAKKQKIQLKKQQNLFLQQQKQQQFQEDREQFMQQIQSSQKQENRGRFKKKNQYFDPLELENQQMMAQQQFVPVVKRNLTPEDNQRINSYMLVDQGGKPRKVYLKKQILESDMSDSIPQPLSQKQLKKIMLAQTQRQNSRKNQGDSSLMCCLSTKASKYQEKPKDSSCIMQ